MEQPPPLPHFSRPQRMVEGRVEGAVEELKRCSEGAFDFTL